MQFLFGSFRFESLYTILLLQLFSPLQKPTQFFHLWILNETLSRVLKNAMKNSKFSQFYADGFYNTLFQGICKKIVVLVLGFAYLTRLLLIRCWFPLYLFNIDSGTIDECTKEHFDEKPGVGKHLHQKW